MRSPAGQLAIAIGGAVLAAAAAVSLVGQVRIVDILALFFGGFGAGAGLVSAVIRWRTRAGD